METTYAPVRERLLEDRSALLAQINANSAESDALRSSTGENRGQLLSEGDTFAVERHVLEKLSAGTRKTLLEIEGALARIQAGTYGSCERCKNQIPVERLEVRPHAKECVPCASRH